MKEIKIPKGYEVAAIGVEIWIVDSYELHENGKFIGKKIVNDITKQEIKLIK